MSNASIANNGTTTVTTCKYHQSEDELLAAAARAVHSMRVVALRLSIISHSLPGGRRLRRRRGRTLLPIVEGLRQS